MDISLRPLQKKDFDRTINFAITGMHFDRYTSVPWELQAYGRYFLYMELERATEVLAAYMGDRLVGILMADMNGAPKTWHALGRSLFVKAVNFVMNILYKNGSAIYDAANADMYRKYRETADPDGEICFLAVDPEIHGKGIGSILLKELERRQKGKLVYLYTDSNCTYQFYEHRGFSRAVEKEIEIKIHETSAPLTCFLYSKVL